MILVLPDGTRCPISNVLDIDGEETSDLTLACTVVAQLPDGRWITQSVEPDEWKVGAASN